MTSLSDFVEQGWQDHANDAPGVAERLPQGLLLIRTPAEAAELAQLAHHVLGEHLGRWTEGLALLAQISPGKALAATLGVDAQLDAAGLGDGAALAQAQQLLERCNASLCLSAGQEDRRASMSVSDAGRVSAMAACNLACHDAARSAALLQDAVDAAARLPDEDPAVRAVSAFSNNLAAALQEREARSAAEQRLMLQAAAVARAHWQRAGGWLEVERAEYRLAHCWLGAGDARQAWVHAQACTQIVAEHGAPPLEAFFAAETRVLCASALDDVTQRDLAQLDAEQAFAALEQADQGWCLDTLQRLRAVATSGRTGLLS